MTTETVPAQNKGGRPKHKLDKEQIRKLAELQCTIREIAYIFGCSTDTIKRNAQDALDYGYANGKIKLRRAMFRNACENHSAPVQIFLAKNLLGMSDNGLVDSEANAPLPWNENLDATD
tara:strand:+ start:86 stop:442 length:357 start_codon:yes stop_codon:yes gene_type:complete